MPSPWLCTTSNSPPLNTQSSLVLPHNHPAVARPGQSCPRRGGVWSTWSCPSQGPDTTVNPANSTATLVRTAAALQFWDRSTSMYIVSEKDSYKVPLSCRKWLIAIIQFTHSKTVSSSQRTLNNKYTSHHLWILWILMFVVHQCQNWRILLLRTEAQTLII